jgi:phosphoribosyl 1,2-cyclic phosphate phosphodiesterase
MKITILGCGTSGGVPRVGAADGGWGNCDPTNPKNRRRRVSILVEDKGSCILIDTSPDLREQLLSAGVTSLDAVFLTHDHADHTHGIDDLRGLVQNMRRRIPIYMNEPTRDTMMQRFGYIFAGASGYSAMADAHILTGDVKIGDMAVRPFRQLHGPIDSIGYRIGRVAYSTDLIDIPPESESCLENLDVWIVDALRHDPHPTHPHLDLTLSWIDKFRPRQAVLTHMDWSMDYDMLVATLPAGVVPAFDGLEIEVG